VTLASAPAPPPRKRNRLLLSQWVDLLDDDSFRRYWLMRLASHGAANALTYSLLVFTLRQSESAAATGVLLLTMIVPSALLGAISGVIIDKLPRGLVLFGSCILRAVLVFVLMSAKDSLPSLYAVSLGLGIVAQFAVPAEAAVLPQIVSQGRLVAANSFINLGTLASQVLGMMILAPIFLKTTNGDPLLFIICGLFAAAAVLITVIPQFRFTSDKGGPRVSVRSARREFAESWMRLNRDPTAFLGLILLVVTGASTLIVATLLPKFSVHVLHVAPENIVFILAPVTIAVFIGLRSVEFLANRFNRLAMISGAYVLMAAALMMLGLVPASADMLESIDPTGILRAIGGSASRITVTIIYANVYAFALTMVLTMGRVLLNERIPMEMQGRVFAAQTVLANLVAIAPVVLAGIAADAVGVEPVLVVAGIAALLAAAWSHARSSRVVGSGQIVEV
jgi:MFS family permease